MGSGKSASDFRPAAEKAGAKKDLDMAKRFRYKS
jgi:hypothetical protein